MLLTKEAMIDNYDQKVWYSAEAITNIFSLKNVKKQYRVTHNSDDSYFIVHRAEFGLPNIIFRQHESGLHYYDSRVKQGNFAFVEMVHVNKSLFTKRQIKGVQQARRLYQCLSHPSIPNFKWVLQTNGIKDCPLSLTDAEIAQKIWGPNIATLKGKTMHKGADAVRVESLTPIPKELLAMHKDVILAIDIFFINKIPFFATLSRNICFTTVTHLTNRTLQTISEHTAHKSKR
jgi:hypothetical protein